MNFKNIMGPGTYEVETKCQNCGIKQKTKIKKGNKAEDVIDQGRCLNCGCQELELI